MSALAPQEGWLRKRGDKGVGIYLDMAWQRRYFYSKPEECLAEYFEKPKEGTALGSIDLSKVRGITRVKAKSFILSTKKREFYLKADNEQAATTWMTHFQNTVTYLKDASRIDKTAIGYHMYAQHADQLDQFCEDFCEGVTIPMMITMISRGALVVTHLLEESDEILLSAGAENLNKTNSLSNSGNLRDQKKINRGTTLIRDDISTPMFSPSLPHVPNQDNVVALLWVLLVKVCSHNELYTGGVLRIDDEEGKIFNFIDQAEDVYKRHSTHFPERLDETFIINPGAQRGLDMKLDKGRWRLPAGKRTVLFFRLGDGTTVVKMENAGCPPFWRGEFRTLDNAKEFGRHTSDFVNYKSGKPKKAAPERTLVRRQEQVPEQFEHAFEDCLETLYPSNIDFNLLMEDGKHNEVGIQESYMKRKLFKQGLTYGVSNMIEILNFHFTQGRADLMIKIQSHKVLRAKESEDKVTRKKGTQPLGNPDPVTTETEPAFNLTVLSETNQQITPQEQSQSPNPFETRAPVVKAVAQPQTQIPEPVRSPRGVGPLPRPRTMAPHEIPPFRERQETVPQNPTQNALPCSQSAPHIQSRDTSPRQSTSPRLSSPRVNVVTSPRSPRDSEKRRIATNTEPTTQDPAVPKAVSELQQQPSLSNSAPNLGAVKQLVPLNSNPPPSTETQSNPNPKLVPLSPRAGPLPVPGRSRRAFGPQAISVDSEPTIADGKESTPQEHSNPTSGSSSPTLGSDRKPREQTRRGDISPELSRSPPAGNSPPASLAPNLVRLTQARSRDTSPAPLSRSDTDPLSSGAKSTKSKPGKLGSRVDLVSVKLLSECSTSTFKMFEVIMDSPNFDNEFDSLAQKSEKIVEKYKVLTQIIMLDRSRGYRGERRGFEACLPNLKLWPEFKPQTKS